MRADGSGEHGNDSVDACEDGQVALPHGRMHAHGDPEPDAGDDADPEDDVGDGVREARVEILFHQGLRALVFVEEDRRHIERVREEAGSGGQAVLAVGEHPDGHAGGACGKGDRQRDRGGDGKDSCRVHDRCLRMASRSDCVPDAHRRKDLPTGSDPCPTRGSGRTRTSRSRRWRSRARPFRRGGRWPRSRSSRRGRSPARGPSSSRARTSGRP